MANGYRHLLNLHADKIKSKENYSFEDILCLAFIDLSEKIGSIEEVGSMLYKLDKLESAKMGFFARMSAVKATIFLMCVFLARAIAMTGGFLYILEQCTK